MLTHVRLTRPSISVPVAYDTEPNEDDKMGIPISGKPPEPFSVLYKDLITAYSLRNLKYDFVAGFAECRTAVVYHDYGMRFRTWLDRCSSFTLRDMPRI